VVVYICHVYDQEESWEPEDRTSLSHPSL
jgi:hypothetical protein